MDRPEVNKNARGALDQLTFKKAQDEVDANAPLEQDLANFKKDNDKLVRDMYLQLKPDRHLTSGKYTKLYKICAKPGENSVDPICKQVFQIQLLGSSTREEFEDRMDNIWNKCHSVAASGLVAQIHTWGFFLDQAKRPTVGITMDYVEGKTVAYEYTAQNLDEQQRVTFQHIVAAFESLHSHGVRHGDPNPNNILVRRSKANGKFTSLVFIELGPSDSNLVYLDWFGFLVYADWYNEHFGRDFTNLLSAKLRQYSSSFQKNVLLMSQYNVFAVPTSREATLLTSLHRREVRAWVDEYDELRLKLSRDPKPYEVIESYARKYFRAYDSDVNAAYIHNLYSTARGQLDSTVRGKLGATTGDESNGQSVRTECSTNKQGRHRKTCTNIDTIFEGFEELYSKNVLYWDPNPSNLVVQRQTGRPVKINLELAYSGSPLYPHWFGFLLHANWYYEYYGDKFVDLLRAKLKTSRGQHIEPFLASACNAFCDPTSSEALLLRPERYTMEWAKDFEAVLLEHPRLDSQARRAAVIERFAYRHYEACLDL